MELEEARKAVLKAWHESPHRTHLLSSPDGLSRTTFSFAVLMFYGDLIRERSSALSFSSARSREAHIQEWCREADESHLSDAEGRRT